MPRFFCVGKISVALWRKNWKSCGRNVESRGRNFAQIGLIAAHKTFSELFTIGHLKHVSLSLLGESGCSAFHKFTSFITTTRVHFFSKTGKPTALKSACACVDFLAR
jgi:hypothetical protein